MSDLWLSSFFLVAIVLAVLIVFLIGFRVGCHVSNEYHRFILHQAVRDGRIPSELWDRAVRLWDQPPSEALADAAQWDASRSPSGDPS